MIWNRFRRSEKGIAVIFVTITLPALMGFALLAIDASRVYNLHSDLQRGADGLAITAAAELDGAPDSITRANRALLNLVDNVSRFSNNGLDTIDISDVTVTYLSEIPASDDLPIDYATMQTIDPLEAHFVEVLVNPTRLNSIFPASFIGGSNDVDLQAVAVAGYGSTVCDWTPVYICNPYENGPVTLEQAVANPIHRRKQIELRQQGGNTAQNFAGNYGFLMPPEFDDDDDNNDNNGNNKGARAILEMIAKEKPPACFSSFVILRTGFIAVVREAINVRFDIYQGIMSKNKNDPEYRPAMNVRKGWKPKGGTNWCKADPADDPDNFQGMPRDDCFNSGTCTLMNGRQGNGKWNFGAYWLTNHGSLTHFPSTGGPMWSNDGAGGILPTRYAVHREEVLNPSIPSLLDHASPGGEIGAPRCSKSTPSDDFDRRLIYGAILNCQELTEQIDPRGGSAGPLPVEAFASFLLTEPVDNSADQIIRVELVDITGRFGRGTLDLLQRDEVQLYR